MPGSQTGQTERILILGASGMLGSEAVRVFSKTCEVFAAVRSKSELDRWGIDAARLGVRPDRLLSGFNAREPDTVLPLLDQVKPTVIFNAAGIIAQQRDSQDAALMIQVNSVWPHALASYGEQRGIRLVHVSTDCVFSGVRGAYTEDDIPDARDLYGRSKLLGEVSDSPAAITLRTSIIGWQYGPQASLAGWFASRRHEKIKGYARAIFSGLTTRAFCETVRDVVLPRPELAGLYHLSADPIDKYHLLLGIAQAMAWQVALSPVDAPVIDKSLDSSPFQAATGWQPPSWERMLADMAQEYATYYC